MDVCPKAGAGVGDPNPPVADADDPNPKLEVLVLVATLPDDNDVAGFDPNENPVL